MLKVTTSRCQNKERNLRSKKWFLTFRFTVKGSPVEVELEQSGAELSSALLAPFAFPAPTQSFAFLLLYMGHTVSVCTCRYVLFSSVRMERYAQTFKLK